MPTQLKTAFLGFTTLRILNGVPAEQAGWIIKALTRWILDKQEPNLAEIPPECIGSWIAIREESVNIADRKKELAAFGRSGGRPSKPLANQPEKQPETVPALPEMKPERPATAAAKEYAEYSDEEYYDILTKANKSIKSVDRTFVDSLEESQLPSEMTELIKILKASEIMAASRENIIFVAKDRVTANRINEISAKQALESALAGFLTNRKAIIAVTPDQKQFLIDYFKARRNNPQPVTEIKTAETAEITPEEPASTDKLDELFGKNGYDIIGE